MPPKRYKPLVDRLFWFVTVPTLALLICGFAVSLTAPIALVIMTVTLLFTAYFLFTPLFGYVELGEESLFIKYGVFLKREIPYSKIRALEKKRGVYTDTMLSLKNSLEHINIRYNSFDVTAVSVVGNDELMREISLRAGLPTPPEN